MTHRRKDWLEMVRPVLGSGFEGRDQIAATCASEGSQQLLVGHQACPRVERRPRSTDSNRRPHLPDVRLQVEMQLLQELHVHDVMVQHGPHARRHDMRVQMRLEPILRRNPEEAAAVLQRHFPFRTATSYMSRQRMPVGNSKPWKRAQARLNEILNRHFCFFPYGLRRKTLRGV